MMLKETIFNVLMVASTLVFPTSPDSYTPISPDPINVADKVLLDNQGTNSSYEVTDSRHHRYFLKEMSDIGLNDQDMQMPEDEVEHGAAVGSDQNPAQSQTDEKVSNRNKLKNK